ncbi:hypothetical protein [Blastococcus mobilis]|uniref:Uncharacterized protein n=1 Tax=Blastococcus mobilis TaxID=1938746 RepID=A0A238VX81_9ACTN|nr:hypothetical protein [Blastococcus mobilis]SNR38910.1 hypothetical protein SAMN06272737_105135 [Blastococcus mobilis]
MDPDDPRFVRLTDDERLTELAAAQDDAADARERIHQLEAALRTADAALAQAQAGVDRLQAERDAARASLAVAEESVRRQQDLLAEALNQIEEARAWARTCWAAAQPPYTGRITPPGPVPTWLAPDTAEGPRE